MKKAMVPFPQEKIKGLFKNAMGCFFFSCIGREWD
jgi:hypothetical protein